MLVNSSVYANSNTIMRARCIYGSVNSKGAHPQPLPGVCQAFVILSVPAVWNLSENLCPGMEQLSFFLDNYRYFYKEYFQCFEREVWFSFHHHPTPQFFFATI